MTSDLYNLGKLIKEGLVAYVQTKDGLAMDPEMLPSGHEFTAMVYDGEHDSEGHVETYDTRHVQNAWDDNDKPIFSAPRRDQLKAKLAHEVQERQSARSVFKHQVMTGQSERTRTYLEMVWG